ncbi:hypothetical protein KRM28CT15_42920 [Krasilnikovia sp. M28-CT-15]
MWLPEAAALTGRVAAADWNSAADAAAEVDSTKPAISLGSPVVAPPRSVTDVVAAADAIPLALAEDALSTAIDTAAMTAETWVTNGGIFTARLSRLLWGPSFAMASNAGHEIFNALGRE